MSIILQRENFKYSTPTYSFCIALNAYARCRFESTVAFSLMLVYLTWDYIQ